MTFDDLESIACGEMGLNISYFYNLTPRQFQNIVDGYTRKAERLSKEKWEQTRWICFYAAGPHCKKIKSLKDTIHFEWDEEDKFSIQDDRTPEEQLKSIKKVWEKIDNNGSTNS